MKGRMSRSSGIEGLRDCVICVSGFSNETTPSREQVKNLHDAFGVLELHEVGLLRRSDG